MQERALIQVFRCVNPTRSIGFGLSFGNIGAMVKGLAMSKEAPSVVVADGQSRKKTDACVAASFCQKSILARGCSEISSTSSW